MSQYEYEYEDEFEDPETGWETQQHGGSQASHETYESFETQELSEALETELAYELLEVTSEEELEEFLGKLVSGVAKGASSFMRSGVGKAIGGALKSVAKTALPMVGSAIGSFVAPGIGTAIGGKLGSMASKLLEAEELETMGEEEAELEAARRYVRWASGTVRRGMHAPSGASPRTVARSAAVSSARRYAPGLLRPSSGSGRTAPWRGRRRRPGSPGRYGRYPRYGYGYGIAPYDADPDARRCSCGADEPPQHGDRSHPEPRDEPADEMFEVMEAFEAPSPAGPTARGSASSTGGPGSGGPSGGGRWYRRGDRVVLVGV